MDEASYIILGERIGKSTKQKLDDHFHKSFVSVS